MQRFILDIQNQGKAALRLVVILLAIQFIRPLSAQIFFPEYSFFAQPFLLDSLEHQANFYDFVHNPASLYEDETQRVLEISQHSRFTSGDDRLPFTAQKISDQNYHVENIQPLSANDLFKGSFAYHRKVERNVMWIDQNYHTGSNPFIFADSSKGDFILNGLYWTAEWAHRFNRHWLSGSSFFYNVDQRLKQIFPKPLNKHRDIRFGYGLQYQRGKWALGFSFAYTDRQEKIEITKYNLQQDLSPVIYKFRFSDLPVIIRGKTSDERKIAKSAYLFSGQFKKEFPNGSVMAEYTMQKQHGNIIDGGSQNIKQGSFNRRNETATAVLRYKWTSLKSIMRYRFLLSRFEAYYPNFNFVFWKAPEEAHYLQLAFQTTCWASFPVFIDAAYGFNTYNRLDLINTNYWRFQQELKSLHGGFIYRLRSRIDLVSWFGLDHINVFNKERSDHSYSAFYKILFEEPFAFFTQNRWITTGALRVTYHYRPMMDVETFFIFSSIKGKENERQNCFLGLRLRLFIF